MFVYLYIHTRVFMLAEDNIAGASLRGRNPSDLKVPKLKRWLLCID